VTGLRSVAAGARGAQPPNRNVPFRGRRGGAAAGVRGGAAAGGGWALLRCRCRGRGGAAGSSAVRDPSVNKGLDGQSRLSRAPPGGLDRGSSCGSLPRGNRPRQTLRADRCSSLIGGAGASDDWQSRLEVDGRGATAGPGCDGGAGASAT